MTGTCDLCIIVYFDCEEHTHVAVSNAWELAITTSVSVHPWVVQLGFCIPLNSEGPQLLPTGVAKLTGPSYPRSSTPLTGSGVLHPSSSPSPSTQYTWALSKQKPSHGPSCLPLLQPQLSSRGGYVIATPLKLEKSLRGSPGPSLVHKTAMAGAVRRVILYRTWEAGLVIRCHRGWFEVPLPMPRKTGGCMWNPA